MEDIVDIRRAYGLQICMDAYNASPERCDSEAALLSLLETLPSFIGMRRLGDPHIVRVTEPSIAGLSGFTFIMESHISIHTYPEKRFVTADIYSCKPFATNEAVQLIMKTFNTNDAEVFEIVRGRRFNDGAAYPP